MKYSLCIIQVAIAISALALGACAYEAGAEMGLTNPAAMYCESQGHAYVIRTDAAGGQYGVCVFSDGTACDGWDFFSGGCAPGHQATLLSQIAGTVNITSEAGLDETVEIHVYKLTECAPKMYVYVQNIVDPVVIHQLVGTLDTDLERTAQKRCPTDYRLLFILEDGSYQTLGFACELATPSMLHGGQAFWKGQGVMAPDSFNLLMTNQIAATPTLDRSEASGPVKQAGTEQNAN